MPAERASAVARAGVVAALLMALAARLATASDYYDSYDSYYDSAPSAKVKSSAAKAPTGDQFGYYSDDDALYYEQYGYYANDAFGYDDYYEGFVGSLAAMERNASSAAPAPRAGASTLQDCITAPDGKPELAKGTAPCAIAIKGVDKHADLLKGGLDGVYKLASCHNGRPLYLREKSPKGEDRVLWYSTGFGDWDVSNGTAPTEAEILMYGGDTQHAVVPLFVDGWFLGADLMSSSTAGDDDYLPVPATVACADGKVYEEPDVNAAIDGRAGPVLTDDEIESKYRYVYETYGRRPDPSPAVNTGFIVLLVVVGLGSIVAIPYLLVVARDPRRGYQPVGTGGFASIIQQSKKKSSGHIH
ncbi:hypothetical protein Rsub_07833 [Raphidocelis subcapitata]|uniref:Uncharacterized protein n=1 Tax=Raphidocelis subcapitata TaxID=307507 RepID=A0A2V0PC59_9CHLO|nr:hypothetical protein Rsub_07833 [Raphidocelis subcapitata]|eukprot:GBF95483.1 hypothetical protein Rsub_07833 [Raphidocelis subcapitata]